jgi:hypothetical protein
VPSPDTGTPKNRSGPRSESGGHPQNRALAKANDTPPEGEAMPVACSIRHDHVASPNVAALHARLDGLDAAWRAGWRACAEVMDEARLAAFADGWEAGLRAGTQRSAA